MREPSSQTNQVIYTRQVSASRKPKARLRGSMLRPERKAKGHGHRRLDARATSLATTTGRSGKRRGEQRSVLQDRQREHTARGQVFTAVVSRRRRVKAPSLGGRDPHHATEAIVRNDDVVIENTAIAVEDVAMNMWAVHLMAKQPQSGESRRSIRTHGARETRHARPEYRWLGTNDLDWAGQRMHQFRRQGRQQLAILSAHDKAPASRRLAEGLYTRS